MLCLRLPDQQLPQGNLQTVTVQAPRVVPKPAPNTAGAFIDYELGRGFTTYTTTQPANPSVGDPNHTDNFDDFQLVILAVDGLGQIQDAGTFNGSTGQFLQTDSNLFGQSLSDYIQQHGGHP